MEVAKVYPPCNTVDFQALPLDADARYGPSTAILLLAALRLQSQSHS